MILTRILFTALLILGVISALGALGTKENDRVTFALMSMGFFLFLTLLTTNGGQ